MRTGELAKPRLRSSSALLLVAAPALGVLLLLGSVSLGMRWPVGGSQAAPADRTRFDDDPNHGTRLRPLSRDYVNSRSSATPTETARPPSSSDAAAHLAASTQSAKVQKDPYPAAASCSVDNVGLAPGETRTCRFTATSSGGWGSDYWGPQAGWDPSTVITVTRAETSTTYGNGKGAFTCTEDIIERGDRVEVAMTLAADDVAVGEVEIGAGEGWDCSRNERS